MQPKIEKLEENKIKVTPYIEAKKSDGSKVWVLDEQNAKEYGRSKMEDERKSAQELKDTLTTKTKRDEWIASQQEILDIMDSIEIELDKPDIINELT